MLQKFKDHIENDFPFLRDRKLLIACSGGVDSVVLTYILKQLEYEIALAHCNFSLRGRESDADEMFVIGLARKLEIPVFAETFDTPKYAHDLKISTQMAARQLRYGWFDEVLKNFNYPYLLTAHHMDDDLETFFINLSRGTGLKGLIGIPPQNQKIVRPLLIFSKDEILNFAQENKLKWREDHSNLKPDYLRNKIRLEVIPKFKETNTTLLHNFQTTQRNLKSSQAMIEDYMSLVYRLVVSETPLGYNLDIQKLQELPNSKALLYELLNEFGFTQWDDVSNLLEAETGKQLFSKTHRLLKNREELILSTTELSNEEEEFEIPKEGIEFPIRLSIEASKGIEEVGKNIIYASGEKIKFPLKLRKWRVGDYFYPFGMNGKKKKLSKFFKDEKISLLEKEKTWILTNGEEIIWVLGYRMDERYKWNKKSGNIFKIKYHPSV